MNKIIFLDIDGVLNVLPKTEDKFGPCFHKHFEDNLRYIIEKTGAKIVISSTWKIDGLEVMQEMWQKRGLAGKVIDITPSEVDVVDRGICEFYDQVDRGFEIQQWIDDHDVESYVILDDVNDMMPSQQNNFVVTSNNKDHADCVNFGYGLTRRCADKAIEILNRNI